MEVRNGGQLKTLPTLPPYPAPPFPCQVSGKVVAELMMSPPWHHYLIPLALILPPLFPPSYPLSYPSSCPPLTLPPCQVSGKAVAELMLSPSGISGITG